jgi:IS5 family transposase
MSRATNSLLWDAVRVIVRLFKAADALVGGLVRRNHRRAAKKRAPAMDYTRNRPTMVQLYRELIKLTRAIAPSSATIRPRIEWIVAQTERRVLHGEAIAASVKIVGLFEPHANIIIKGGREVQYGHKPNLTTGRSGLILDLVIEAGNPADS